MLRPFGRYYAYCGTGQSWRMFVAPHRHPTALHVDVRERGEWRPAYVERDPHHRWLGRVLGDRAPVKSHHHQGVGRIGDGLVETAWAEDGTIEGLEDPTRSFAVGVLWHPEAGEDFALFEGLVAEAGRYAAERR